MICLSTLIDTEYGQQCRHRLEKEIKGRKERPSNLPGKRRTREWKQIEYGGDVVASIARDAIMDVL